MKMECKIEVPGNNFLDHTLIQERGQFNVVMVAIDMCGKSPITGVWIHGIT